MNNKILVTGADGFIGKSLCKKLSKKGFFVIALILNKKNSEKDLRKIKNLKIIEADITQKNLSGIINQNFDFCIHLAGISDVNFAEKNPKKAEKINVEGTNKVLQACKKLNCKGIIFASSNKVYGKGRKGLIDEKSKVSGETIYAKTKISAEKKVLDFCKKNKIAAIIARQTNVYGIADSNLTRLIPASILCFMENKIPEITSDPSTQINLIYLDDALDFYLKAIKYVEKNNRQEIVNVTNDKSYCLMEIINSIAKEMGKKEISTRVKKNKYEVKFSNIKAKKLLNWQPKTALKAGLKKTVEWYKERYKQVCTKSINKL
ncbi:MAG: hypothetical protein COT15_03740 [Candidatus Diapherotrites archaeon CG08_land_8_20_14_0_20_34_12]|nr:MAG: hypothetical protein COT15_03740 [Candidatus Diapherotrites archaeon CG08_land_8_20_14_0_20_34_12]